VRILRNLVYLAVIVAGIVLASANMTPVRFVYIPRMAFLSTGEQAEAEVPLALLLLFFLLAGAVVAGTGTFVEHVRLRFLVRRNEKVVKALRGDLEKSRLELEQAQAALAARASELASEQARARRAEESEARALAEAGQERSRAEEAERAMLVAPAES
jgi:cell division protein FtsL